jgi:hypothetical protein
MVLFSERIDQVASNQSHLHMIANCYSLSRARTSNSGWSLRTESESIDGKDDCLKAKSRA